MSQAGEVEAGPYAQMADQLLAGGWQPIPMTRPMPDRGSPPKGYTGGMDGVAGPREVSLWKAMYSGAHNVAVRLHPDQVSLDVDDYDGKPGARTIKEMEAAVGMVLPPTWRSSSRFETSPASGIRHFRLPGPVDESSLPGALPGLEIIRAGHRYAIVGPSVNEKTMAQYRWLNEATGEVTDQPPARTDLAVLPQAFIDYLVAYRAKEKADEAARLAAMPIPDSDGDACGIVKQKVTFAIGEMDRGVSHHDVVRDSMLRMYGLARDGHRGWQDGVRILRKALYSWRAVQGVSESVTDDEWSRMLDGAQKKVATQAQITECMCSATPELIDWISKPPVESPSPERLTAGVETPAPVANPYGYVAWDQAFWSPPPPRYFIPGMLIESQVGTIYSAGGLGKSLLALDISVGLAHRGRVFGEAIELQPVLYIDRENSRRGVMKRLRAMGYHDTELPLLHYSLLGDWPPLDTREGGQSPSSE